jgi:hypothetical protein
MKKSIVIALVACLMVATFAAVASAATGQQKLDAFKNCKGGFAECCRQSGGQLITYQDEKGYTHVVCEFSDDRYGVTSSVRPQYIVEYSGVLYVP